MTTCATCDYSHQVAQNRLVCRFLPPMAIKRFPTDTDKPGTFPVCEDDWTCAMHSEGAVIAAILSLTGGVL